jgi:hypothetical protein
MMKRGHVKLCGDAKVTQTEKPRDRCTGSNRRDLIFTRQAGLEPATYGLEDHRRCHTASPGNTESHGFTTFPSPSVTTRHPAARDNCKRICENSPARASGHGGDV